MKHDPAGFDSKLILGLPDSDVNARRMNGHELTAATGSGLLPVPIASTAIWLPQPRWLDSFG